MDVKKRLKSHHDSMDFKVSMIRGPKKTVDFLDENNGISHNKKKSCIYIHVPFCTKICTFCSLTRNLSEPVDDYHKLVIEEIENYSKFDYIKNTVFDAVYFGGGTPTTLKKEYLKDILCALKDNFNFTDDAEFSTETTVTEFEQDKIIMLKNEGLNRLSIGVQTFSDRGRSILGRKGSGDIAYKKIQTLLDQGFRNINIDIIYNYDNQTEAELLQDLNKVYDLDLAGFSLYSLMNMGKFKSNIKRDSNVDKRLFDTIADNSEKEGYHFIELTKMVKRDQYKYIINRHTGQDTLPLGAGAGGNLNSFIIMNKINLDEYRQSISQFSKRKGMLLNAQYMERMRIKGDLQRGIIPQNYSLVKNNKKISRFIATILDKGLASKKDEKIRFTKEGIFWGNNISKEFLDLL